jgi:hypothetical protein
MLRQLLNSNPNISKKSTKELLVSTPAAEAAFWIRIQTSKITKLILGRQDASAAFLDSNPYRTSQNLKKTVQYSINGGTFLVCLLHR